MSNNYNYIKLLRGFLVLWILFKNILLNYIQFKICHVRDCNDFEFLKKVFNE